jgi:cytochrome c2
LEAASFLLRGRGEWKHTIGKKRQGGMSMNANRIAVAVALSAGMILVGARAASAGAAEGKTVFQQKKCILCHSLGSEKGPMAKLGGPLDGIGAKRDAAWLKAYLTDPKSKIPDAKMPKKAYTPQELEGLVDYMLSLK